MGFQLNNDQIYATYKGLEWKKSLNKQIFEISGAAGTGKTTLVRHMIEQFNLELDEVLFMAYMGKAAMALARNGLPAKTIHSAIYDYVKVVEKEDGKIVFNSQGKPKTRFTFRLKEKIGKNIRLIVIDEGSMVPEGIAKDILSFGIPVIVLGDLNQLPPVFGNSFFLQNPDVILSQIMRQAEGNPIIFLSQEILGGKRLRKGIYGNSAVIDKSDLTEYLYNQADIVLTGTNRLRYEINTMFREHIKRNIKLAYPNVGEKIICRKNNWNKCLSDDIYLMNGMAGIVSYIDIESFNGKQLKIDFQPSFTNKVFKNLLIDYEALFSNPNNELQEPSQLIIGRNKFEFAYAITVHLSQGSQYENVLFLTEKMSQSEENYRRYLYTGITRASEQITIAI